MTQKIISYYIEKRRKEFDKEFPELIKILKSTPFAGVNKANEVKDFHQKTIEELLGLIREIVENHKPIDFKINN